MKFSRHIREYRRPLLLIAVLSLAACADPARQAARRADTAERARERTEQQQLRIPKGPRHLFLTYSDPPYGIRQAFMWGKYATEWRLTVVDYTADHAGFYVKRPFLLPPQRDNMALFFEISPPEAIHTVALGLIDDIEKKTEHIPVLAIAPYRIHRRTEADREAVSIPLYAFTDPTRAVPVNGVTVPEGTTLDWANIRGIHLVRLVQGPDQPRGLTLRNFQFAPVLWVQGLQKEPDE